MVYVKKFELGYYQYLVTVEYLLKVIDNLNKLS